jgi:diguanylate cyclase (GGDEF)-like protein
MKLFGRRRKDFAIVEDELLRMNQQLEATRELLSRVQQDLADANSELARSQAMQLVEANEELVLFAMRSQQKADTAEAALDAVARSAELDGLTALPNRAVLLDRFTNAIELARRHAMRSALLFIDLNHFKQVNDRYGHAVGDQVLQLVAHRLASTVRSSDTVSRHGGDEFLVLLFEVARAADAALMAEKIVAALAVPAQLAGHTFTLKASIGISIFPDDGDDPATLIGHADAAMYRAKRHGLNSFVFHASSNEMPIAQARPPATHDTEDEPKTLYEMALAEHERRAAVLREANEQLVLTLLKGQGR